MVTANDLAQSSTVTQTITGVLTSYNRFINVAGQRTYYINYWNGLSTTKIFAGNLQYGGFYNWNAAGS